MEQQKISTANKIEMLSRYISTLRDMAKVVAYLKGFTKRGLKSNEWVQENSLRITNAFKVFDELIAELAKEIDATDLNIGSLENYIQEYTDND